MSETLAMVPSERLWPPLGDADFTFAIRRYVEEKVFPEADRIDAEDIYPAGLAKDLALKGYSAITLPAAYGGGDRSFAYALAAFEEIAVGSAALAVSLLSTFQAQTIIRLFGSEALKAQYLPRFASGLLGSYALTEAAHGSDIRSLDTKAERRGETWILNGEKHGSRRRDLRYSRRDRKGCFRLRGPPRHAESQALRRPQFRDSGAAQRSAFESASRGCGNSARPPDRR